MKLNTDDTRCVIWGALLGAVFGSALGAGLTGFWDWVYLFDVPVRHGPEVLTGLAIGGLAGIVWGFLAAYPRRWWMGVLFSTTMVALAFFIPPGTRSSLILLPAILIDWVLAGLLRGLLKAFDSAGLCWNQAKEVWPALVILSVLLFGLAITWPLDQASEAIAGRRAMLQKVHRYGQAQGWQDYVLQLESMDSSYGRVTVFQSGGESFTCMVQWQEPAPGDPAFYDLMGITCEP